MIKDKYTAVWVSHSSIGDFLKCPRAYFLNNVYKDPRTGHKISLISPPLALGQAVHEVVESLSVLPVEKRFEQSLQDKFEKAWEKVSGRKGGFEKSEEEERFKKRGKEMIDRVVKNPGPLKNLAVKIKMNLPYYWLSEKDNIILCGKIDWLEYLPETDSVHIIDFKTGVKDEDGESLQLPIYHLLVANCQKRKVTKASYWYLERNKEPQEISLPDIKKAHKRVFEIAQKVKKARLLKQFSCTKKDGCFACRPLEAVLCGAAKFIGVDGYNRDIYYVPKSRSAEDEKSMVL